MSTSYTIFVKNKEEKTVVISGLELILNCRLNYTFNHEEYHSTIVMGLGISLLNSIPYDDDEIKYSDFDYEIMIEYKGLFDNEYSNDFRRIATLVLADMISQNLKCECLAVENLTEILGEFISSK